LIIGFYLSGQVGEIFLDRIKVGSTLDTHLDEGAALARRNLKYFDRVADLSQRP
jgi:hypothetical protein